MKQASQVGCYMRKPVMKDVVRIQELVDYYAKSEITLFQSLNDISENLRDFVVLEVDFKIIGCGALHFFGDDFAEVRSLVIDPKYSKHGYGSIIVNYLLEEAKFHGIKCVFCITIVERFFAKLGFHLVPHSDLPQKVYKDCINCEEFGNCDRLKKFCSMIFAI